MICIFICGFLQYINTLCCQFSLTEALASFHFLHSRIFGVSRPAQQGHSNLFLIFIFLYYFIYYLFILFFTLYIYIYIYIYICFFFILKFLFFCSYVIHVIQSIFRQCYSEIIYNILWLYIIYYKKFLGKHQCLSKINHFSWFWIFWKCSMLSVGLDTIVILILCAFYQIVSCLF